MLGRASARVQLIILQQRESKKSKVHSNNIGLLQKQDGTYTEEGKESLNLLIQQHFSKSVPYEDTDDKPSGDHVAPLVGKEVYGHFFTPERVKWAINSFGHFKSSGEDGAFPALLQRGLDILLPTIIKLFSESYAHGNIPQE